MVEEPPGVESTDQETAVFDEPVTVAVNMYVEPARMLAVEGVTVTVTAALAGGGFWAGEEEEAEEPQEATSGTRKRIVNRGKLLEREDMMRTSLWVGREGDNWTEEQDGDSGSGEWCRARTLIDLT